MKVKRYKQARKTLKFYTTHFNLFEPYQVLVDATFCQAAIECKIHITSQLEKYLGGSVSLFTSPCIVEEVRKLGSEYMGAMLLNRKMEHRKCGHTVGKVSARDCITSVIGPVNKFKMLVATQDKELRAELREIPCTPLLYIDYNAPILEPVSKASVAQAEAITMSKLAIPAHEQKILSKMHPQVEQVEPVPKKKKRKAPNSLSCKKKASAKKPVPTKKSNGLQKSSNVPPPQPADAAHSVKTIQDHEHGTESPLAMKRSAEPDNDGVTEEDRPEPKKRRHGKRGKKKSQKTTTGGAENNE